MTSYRTLQVTLLIISLGSFELLRADWNAIPLDSTVSLHIESKAADANWKKGSIAIKKGNPLKLRVNHPGSADAEIRWFQIIPDLSRFYKNANHPWEENPYKWIGFGKIEYQKRELKAWRNQSIIDKLDAENLFKIPEAPRNYRSDIGSFWLQVEIESKGKRKRSAGLQENTSRNLSPSVFRLTIRKDDSYLGHLTGFFNVPGLFGSIPYQCSNYIGVDCADVLVTARRKWLNLSGSKDYNVSMLVSDWPRVTKFSLRGGIPTEKPVNWGKTVKPGDLIAVKYSGRSRYQHIGALYQDTNENNVLDGADLILHAGPDALHLTPLRRGSFDGEVVILRPSS